MLGVENLVKAYGAVQAVKGISFEVETGDIFTLLGPSGCGKTTTLQCIAGLETPTSGEIRMGDSIVYSSTKKVVVPANKRRLGMVFQSYAIWPHMSVYDNVAFPLVHGGYGLKTDEVRGRVMKALESVQMSAFAERPAPHLSGGQQQRVALARAIVHEPRLLLLDEPLSNLDAKLRDTMRVELRQMIKNLGITTIFVTHDQVEALSMSDQIVLLEEGKIVQQGTSREIYLAPESSITSDFMGRSNLIPGRLLDAADGTVETPFGTMHCTMAKDLDPKQRLCVAIRPAAIALIRKSDQAANPLGHNQFYGHIKDVTFLGDTVEATVEIDRYLLRATFSPYEDHAVGEDVLVDFGRGRCVAVNDDSGVWNSAS